MADTPKVYVLCDANCKWEGMTREQILTAITQAVNEGTIGNIDTGFVQTIKTINGQPLKFFVGTQAEYNTLATEAKENLFAIITDDTHKDGIEAAIAELQTNYTELLEKLANGDQAVGKADFATNATNANHANTAYKSVLWSGKKEITSTGGNIFIAGGNLANRLLVVEIEAYTAPIYGSQFVGKIKSNPFMSVKVQYQTVTITPKHKVRCFADIEGSFYTNGQYYLYYALNKATGETSDRYYITAIYEV